MQYLGCVKSSLEKSPLILSLSYCISNKSRILQILGALTVEFIQNLTTPTPNTIFLLVCEQSLFSCLQTMVIETWVWYRGVYILDYMDKTNGEEYYCLIYWGICWTVSSLRVRQEETILFISITNHSSHPSKPMHLILTSRANQQVLWVLAVQYCSHLPLLTNFTTKSLV